jgi:Skp family chaperone for outer membrane proteins
MLKRHTVAIWSAGLATVLWIGTARAQTQQTPTSPGLGGPLVPGVCLLSRAAIFANAAVGKAALARLKQLSDVAQAEIDAEKKKLENDVHAYQAGAVKLTAEERRSREQALKARVQSVEVKAQQRSREMDATRAKALQRIADEAQPLIAQTYGSHSCGLLIDRDAVFGGNMGNDLTPAVVQALDAKITSISFNREILPSSAAAQSAGVN